MNERSNNETKIIEKEVKIIPVKRRMGKNLLGKDVLGEIEWLKVNEIQCAISLNNSKTKKSILVLHVQEKEYQSVIGVDDTIALLQNEDDFFKTDRGFVANLSFMPLLDEKKLKLFYVIGDKRIELNIMSANLDALKSIMQKFLER
ncbi:hypothetical protein [Paenibacillus sp. Marseille-Q4541]|uniref:hypothetical protein n=1 Tax=Paenibacillus sp. Marseille-Q4541 TaxID=2831522 RepID=UPI001BA95437|nr:hypothetical protein [Paenibacillus sp. Marseille-Q4541]